VFITDLELLYGVSVHAALVRERIAPYERIEIALTHVGQFRHEIR